MVYAILHAASDSEELITVAYGESAEDLARWFLDELRDTAEMYLSDESDFEKLDNITENLQVLCNAKVAYTVTDTDTLDVINTLAVEVGKIALAVVGAYETYDGLAEGLRAYLADKPSYRRAVIPNDAEGDLNALDALNASLIRCGIN